MPVYEYHGICRSCGVDFTTLVDEAIANGYTTAQDYHRAQTVHDHWDQIPVETGQYTTQVIPEQRFTEHHDAVTQTVHHDAVYGERCSGCGTTR